MATTSPGLMPGPGRSILCSNSMWFWGGRPTQALQGTVQAQQGHLKTVFASPESHPPPGAPENILDTAALAEEGIHHRAARGHKRCLKEEAEYGQHWVEALRLRVRGCAEAHSLTQLSEQNQVQHDWCGQERVLDGGGCRL